MALVDGELPCERAEAIQVHLDLCPECTEVAKQIEESRSAFAAWPVEDLANANRSGVKIARTATLKLSVRSVEDARDSMSALLLRRGGHIAQLSANSENNAQPVVVASLRIPSDQISECIGELRRLGRVTLESQTGEEVTERYVDLNARLSNERKTEARINEVIKNRAGNLKEVLEAESESARVRGEIERMEAEQKALDKRIEFATIAITFSEEYRAELQSPAPTAGRRLRNALVDGARDAREAGLGLVLWAFSILPTAMLWTAILFLPARWGWRRWRVLSQA
jgi:uncharacterized protein DUF4349/putative zinc finger protein